jgi:phosphomannomutase
MTLIKSISGIRGTIGGKAGDGLSPVDVLKFTSAYGAWIQKSHPGVKCNIVIGRDARISGQMVSGLVSSTLMSLGIDVVDTGLSTTPTVEMAVPYHQAQGGIILTASHNPKQWNALKLLNAKGEFISAEDGADVLEIAEHGNVEFADVNALGKLTIDQLAIARHIEAVLALPMVDRKAIKAKKFVVAIDCVNSTGGIALPPLLKALGVEEVIELYCTPDGNFPHNPEPLPEHLTEISKVVVKSKAHVGLVVDPDVDDWPSFVKMVKCLARNIRWWLLPTMFYNIRKEIQFLIFLQPVRCVM